MDFLKPNPAKMPSLPVFYTPLSRWHEHYTTERLDCAPQEIDFARCSAAVGGTRAKTECSKYFEDLYECMYSFKSRERHRIMQAERKKQGKQFSEAPPPDSVKSFAL